MKQAKFEVTLSVPDGVDDATVERAMALMVNYGFNDAVSQYNNQFGPFGQEPLRTLFPNCKVAAVTPVKE